MTFDNRYSSTVPAPLEGMVPASASVETAPELRRPEFEATGAAGTELAAVVGQLRQQVTALAVSLHLTSAQAGPLLHLLDDAARIGMQGRLLAKLTSGSVRQHNGQVRLDVLLGQLLDVRSASARPAIPVRRAIAPASVIVDRDLVTALIDTALDWAMEPGRALEVSLQIKDWPAHALLWISWVTEARPVAQEPAPERLGWYLILEIAHLLGVTIDRVRSPGQMLLMLEFPRTVQEFEGLTAMEVEFGAPNAVGDSSSVMAGHRALIISSDVKLREEAKRVCRDMGLAVDNVPTSMLAAKRCATDPPDILIVDERFNDEQFQQLRSQLCVRQPDFPVVEIVYHGAPPVAAWGDDGVTRVARSEVLTQLPQALTLEMSKLL